MLRELLRLQVELSDLMEYLLPKINIDVHNEKFWKITECIDVFRLLLRSENNDKLSFVPVDKMLMYNIFNEWIQLNYIPGHRLQELNEYLNRTAMYEEQKIHRDIWAFEKEVKNSKERLEHYEKRLQELKDKLK
jgi:DNA gyrase/topoisomerase IV subunit A